MERIAWVFLAYRLPREPSTPRIAVWRKLRQLGVVQVLDGLVALPRDARTTEQLEWVADTVLEAGGEASLWFGQAATATQERHFAARMADAVAAEYRDVAAEAQTAGDQPEGQRRRTLGRLRRELRRIRSRDFFPPPEANHARQAVEALAQLTEPAGR